MKLEPAVFGSFAVDVLSRYRDIEPHDIERKPWGVALHVAHCRNGQLSLAVLNSGGFCSRHYHERKVNSFNVQSGRLAVRIWRGTFDVDVRPADETIVLTAGKSLVVEPAIVHQMEALENTVCMEAYYTLDGSKVCLKDIHRFTAGGLNVST